MVKTTTLLIFVAIAMSFLATIILTKTWIRAARKFGLVGKDMNKLEKKEVSEAGGIAVLFGFLAGLFFYLFFITFILQSQRNTIEILAAISALLMAGFVGFIDDILGWKSGLKQWQKPLLMLPAAVPLMVTNVGHSTINLPVLGSLNLGIIYPLLFIPLGIMGAANGFNMLAGLNGLEAGMGLIITTTLGITAYLTGFAWVATIAFLYAAALFAFLLFNKYPAKVFPGDSLTYSTGAFVAILAIFADMERIAIFLFLPFILEFILKARYWFKTESFGTPNADGTLTPPEKISSLTHIFMKLFRTEKKTVFGLYLLEIALALAVLIFYV